MSTRLKTYDANGFEDGMLRMFSAVRKEPCVIVEAPDGRRCRVGVAKKGSKVFLHEVHIATEDAEGFWIPTDEGRAAAEKDREICNYIKCLDTGNAVANASPAPALTVGMA